ncbi:MAG: cell division protein ZapA [Mucispirillum sp.]|nr:cell division protein ZapA [Mucispirillum sp.]
MRSFELTILGQHLLLNIPEGQEQYYKDIANELSDMMDEFLKKSPLRSDVKAAVSVAYKLLLENKQLKETISYYESIDSKIDDLITKVDNK